MATEHKITIGTADDVPSEYLVDVLMWGLDQHNTAVMTHDRQEHYDKFIQPTRMTIMREDDAREGMYVLALSVLCMIIVGVAIGVQF